MKKNSLSSSKPFLFIFFVIYISLVVEGLVPLSKTFKFVNHGKLLSNGISTEKIAQFLPIPHITNHPFHLCFYTTTKTKSLFTLGLSMGSRNLQRQVWSANTNWPVGVNASLIFGVNGNLILADANKRAVWQTQTANKGVTDIKLLPNGNIVLVDKRGGIVWQSFDSPSDTLLNGQGLRGDGSSKLASGSYSMSVVNRLDLTLSFKHKKYPALTYHTVDSSDDHLDGKDPYSRISFSADGKTFGILYDVATTGKKTSTETLVFGKPLYNTTLSMLQLGKDGNLRVYTYNGHMSTWENSKFSYFPSMFSECNLPEKCGAFGLCKNSKCVSCPSSKDGLMAAWSKECKREKMPHCHSKSTKAAEYYKLVEVRSSIEDHSGEYRKMTVDECKMKCSKDCKCSGFFYRRTSGEGYCLVATGVELYTLTTDSMRFGLGQMDPVVDTYIKYAK